MPLKLTMETCARDVLDFSKLVITSREDLDKNLAKVPDYRNRPEKVRVEDLRMDEKNFSFNATKSELEPPEYEFACPIPAPLHKVKLEDLRHVDINWHMLTELRAETKIDEDIFNRIVQMERVTYKTVLLEREQAAKASNRMSKTRKAKPKATTKGNVPEEKSNVCQECADEFCHGSCKKFLYEEHERLPPADDDDEVQKQHEPLVEDTDDVKEKKKVKKKKKKVVKTVKSGEGDKDKSGDKEEKSNPVAKKKLNSSKKSGDTQKQGVSVQKQGVPAQKPGKITTKKSKSSPNLKVTDTGNTITTTTAATPTTVKAVAASTTASKTKPVKSKSSSNLATKKSTSSTKPEKK